MCVISGYIEMTYGEVRSYNDLLADPDPTLNHEPVRPALECTYVIEVCEVLPLSGLPRPPLNRTDTHCD